MPEKKLTNRSQKQRLSEDLSWRGFIKDKTFRKDSWLDTPGNFYHGVDGGSADSLTVGNLAVLMLAVQLSNYGWKPILLVGGATSLIGDPGGKVEERVLPKREEVFKNVEAIKKQMLELFAGLKPVLVNNIDWHDETSLLDFLREVGKHYPVSELVQRDYIAERLGDEGSGISFTEFSYTLLQGYDYLYLHRKFNASLQVGGSDQWGNMLSGVNLIRKKESTEVHALSMPLIVNKKTGAKFGKSEAGAIWLDSGKTTPTQFYQFWINVSDEDVEEYLKIYTLLPKVKILDLLQQHKSSPEKRIAQLALADSVTEFVHGKEEAHSSKVVTMVLVGETSPGEVSEGILKQLRHEIPAIKVKPSSSIISALVSSGLSSSNSDSRRLLAAKSVYINNAQISREDFMPEDFVSGRLLMRRGKAYKDSALVEIS